MLRIYLTMYAITAILSSNCADHNERRKFTTKHETLKPIEKSSCQEDSCLNLDDEASLKMVDMQLSFFSSVLATNQMTVDITCFNALGSGVDYIQTSVPVSLTAGLGSVALVAAKACSITVQHYFDGSSTEWLPAVSPLTINISSSGVVSTINNAVHYVASSSNVWLTVVPNGTYAAILYTAFDPASTSAVVVTPINSQSTSLTVQNVPAPVVTNFALYSSSLNGGSIIYTLSGSVSASGTLACKYIDNTANSITKTSWSSVNSFFSGVTGTTCPTLNVQDNWTSIYASDKTYLVVFANTVGNLTSYATYSVGP